MGTHSAAQGMTERTCCSLAQTTRAAQRTRSNRVRRGRQGAHTVVANVDGDAFVLPFAESTLAIGGSGDVLAGNVIGFGVAVGVWSR